jgi:hypothetical protein
MKARKRPRIRLVNREVRKIAREFRTSVRAVVAAYKAKVYK